MWGVSGEENKVIDQCYETALERLDFCFSHLKNKYYHFNEETVFNPLHVAQWTMFLYTMANTIKTTVPSCTDLCDKIYGISKCFSSADIYYEVEMPKIWFFDHPQGSVLGRAEYGDFFSFSQGCTVGNNKGAYPVIGEYVSIVTDSTSQVRNLLIDKYHLTTSAVNEFINEILLPCPAIPPNLSVVFE